MPVMPSQRLRFPGEASKESYERQRLLAFAKKLKDAGKEIITIGEGDPVQFGFVNEFLSNFLAKAAEMKLHMYPYATTYQSDLKHAIAEFEKKHRYANYSAEDIILTPGVAGAFQVLHYALLDPGDEIVTFEPSHYLTGPASYLQYFQSKVKACKTTETDDWSPHPEELRKMINERTKAIVLGYPNNPTGAVSDEKTLKDIIDVAGEHDLPIVSDEIYCLLTFDGVEVKTISLLAKDVPAIMLSGMSKVFMATGWRVGYMCFHDPQEKISEVVEAMKKVATSYGHASSCIPTPILYAATEAFRKAPLKEAKEMMRQLQVRRDFTWKRLNEIEGMRCTKPKGAFYAFPHLDAIGEIWKTDIDFLFELLEQEHVLFSFPGSMYGNSVSTHFRTLLLPKLEVLEIVFDKLERFLSKRTKSKTN